MMEAAYAALPQDRPIHSVQTAFSECETLTLWDVLDARQHPHRIPLPERPGAPWDDVAGDELPGFWSIVATGTRWALDAWQAVLHWSTSRPDAAHDLQQANQLAADTIVGSDTRAARVQLVGWLKSAVRRLRRRYREVLRSNPLVRLVYTTLDAFAAMAKGIVDDVLGHPDGFGAVDGWEWTAWLRKHGASAEHTATEAFEARAPVLRAVYDVAFCFPGGRISDADAAAGTATNDLLRLLFGFRGRLLYRMQAGMGDAIATPLYELLLKRGVKFRFFHAVTGFGVEDGWVETIEFVRQVERADGYDPLVSARGVPSWPAEPLWDRLGAGAQAHGTAYESELNPARRPRELLLRGPDKDFTDVVLAIPVGALGEIGAGLSGANARFRQMVKASSTVQTQAYQLWTGPSSAELGLQQGAGIVAAGFAEPLDTYADMAHVLERETWPEPRPRGLLYGCGVLADGEDLADVRERVAGLLEQAAGSFWPQAVDPETSAFRWDVLFDRAGRTGSARLAAQYLRANTAPWERYVITPAGSVAARLGADESGFANLVLAGDWTKNGIDGGCVEAAVVSGLQAARALGADPLIFGEGTTWL